MICDKFTPQPFIERIRENYATFSGRFPAYGEPGPNGTDIYRLTPNQNWLAAFWSGLLWLAAAHTGDDADIQRAQSLLPSFEDRLDQNIRLNHDIGFLFTLSARAQWQMTGDAEAHTLALRAAQTLLGRYHPVGGYIQAWDDEPGRDERGRFIIDCMMNLPLLFWAGQETGDPRYTEAALTHARTSARYLMRGDGSSYHTFYLNPETGDPVGPKTHQGFADDSLWARGQGWAIYGFALAYEWTGDRTFKAAAEAAAARYLEDAPPDRIVPWDFHAPAPAYPDSSADAIAAGGMLRLAALTGDRHYHDAAERRLCLLVDQALDTRPDAQGLLRHGSQHVPHDYGVDTYTIFGDFFFLEAMMTLLNDAPDFWGCAAKARQPMTYFTSLSTDSGANTLDTNPCDLLDFQLIVLDDGQSVNGSTGDREALAVLLGGKVTVKAGDTTFENVGDRPNVFAGKPTSVYLPTGTDYTLTGVGHVEIALVSAPSDLQTEPYVITPDQVVAGRWGAANFSRNFHKILTESEHPELPARRLIVGETFTPSGHWSTYPAHKHEKDEGSEAFHEEMYFFKVAPADGFGIVRHYGDGYEDNHTVRDNTILMMPHGYHTYVGAPGYDSYYLWFLAGEHRTQGVSADPETGWVNNTVRMLRNLGH